MARPTSLKNRNPVQVQIKVPAELHEYVKIAAKANRQSMHMYILSTLEKEIKHLMEEDVDSPGFIPAGLRR